MTHIIAILGSTGQFGRVMANHIFYNLKHTTFYLLMRNPVDFENNNKIAFVFDFNKNKSLPDFPEKPDLLVDLTGPVSEDSPKVFEMCLKARIPYMDISMNVHHLKNCRKIFEKYKKGMGIVHAGFFPGLSTLMVSCLIREMPKNSSFILANDFPAYAGGGYKVAETMKDILENNSSGYYFSNGIKIRHLLHEGPVKIQFQGRDKIFYRWFLPETVCLEYSLNPANFSRLISVRPVWINPIMKIFALFLHKLKNPQWVITLIKINIYFLKRFIFKKFKPSIVIEAMGINKNSSFKIVLKTSNAVSLHGEIMLGFIKAFLNLEKRKKLNGVYTPEQLFAIEDILSFGDYENYFLEKMKLTDK